MINKPKEEIYLAKRNWSGYYLAHIIPEEGNSLEQLNFFTTLNFYDLCWYLRGACFGKSTKTLDFYNGMPNEIKDKCKSYSLAKVKLSFLKEKDLDHIILVSEIKEKFEGKIKMASNYL